MVCSYSASLISKRRPSVSDQPSVEKLHEKIYRQKTLTLVFVVFVTCMMCVILLSIPINEEELHPNGPPEKFDEVKVSSTEFPPEELIDGTESVTDEAYNLALSSPPPPMQDDQKACRVPTLNPFDSSIKHLIKKPEVVDCEHDFPLLFKSTPDFTLVPLKSMEEIKTVGIKSCCYLPIRRKSDKDRPDDAFKFSHTCYPVSLTNATKVWEGHEFIAITCERLTETNTTSEKNPLSPKDMEDVRIRNIVDMHAFVYLKPLGANNGGKIQEKVNKKKISFSSPMGNKGVNVIVLGIDAVSHMNFIRTMPQSYAFLMNELDAVEMHAFNKIGDNTFPNVGAILTSLNASEITSTCEKNKTFDDCPLIFKKFSEHGYHTMFGEDSPWMGLFNYLKTGFKKPPTDYYLRPFAVAAEKHIGTHRKGNCKFCYGPRLSFQVLLDYIQKMAWAMNSSQRRYFQFMWANSLTHDYLNHGRLGDTYLRSTLEWFKSGGYLNKTILILMSDHGIRWGAIRNYPQGEQEERLPLLYFVTPQWFKTKYTRAYNNLLNNRQTLTTPFDLYETLNHLLHLERITDENLQEGEEMLESSTNKSGGIPRAISQFLPIPLSRTCEQAGIEDRYCSCHQSKPLPIDNTLVKQAANYAVHYINGIISNYSQCGILALDSIKNAKIIQTTKSNQQKEKYQVAFSTTPGGAEFEALAVRNHDGVWNVTGTISRINLVGNQNDCVLNKEVKLYCYCVIE